MNCEAETKGVESIGKAKKRRAGESLELRRGKRVKSKVDAAVRSDEEGKREQEQGQCAGQDEVFRFMELPGELRNRIYTHAEDYAHRCFPPLYPKSKSRSAARSRSSRSPLSLSSPGDTPRPEIPHLSLTQVSSQIRSEFRPAWLSTTKIPLSMLATYLKAFYPLSKPNTPPDLRKRLESQFSHEGQLRLLVRESEIADVDIIPLIRHAVRFPNFTLKCLGMPSVKADMVASIQGLVDNKTQAWVRDVREKRVTQIRIMANRSRPWMRIVVKERYAERWMMDGITKDDKMGGYVRSRGLEGVAKFWRLAFGVEYA